MKFYTDTNDWIHVTGKNARIGITQNGLEGIGEIVFIELPKLGIKVQKDDVVCVLESTKAACDVYAPLGGKITQVNHALIEDITILNRSPEKDGWLYEISDYNEQELATIQVSNLKN